MSQDDPTIESAPSNEARIQTASIPATIGRYQVRRLHGRGGMGEVFLAHDPVLDRDVAVKLISGDLETAQSQERLVREARAAGRLRHPNIVTIFDAGEHEGRPFIAMEFVRGETLGSLIRRQAPLPLSRRLELIEGACAGLAHAHRSGVVHFDIKPDNLMLDESGTVKVLDFGIARVIQSGLLVTRQLGGTLRYMSPEQIESQPLDHRSDVFSLGCALFEMITFVPAFVGSTKDIVTQISGGPMPAPRDVLPELEPRLDGIVLKAMALDRTRRYSTLDELGAELAAVRKRLAPGYDPRVPTAVSGLDDTPTMLASPKRGAARTSSTLRRLHSMGRRSWIGTLVFAGLLSGASVFWMFRRSGPVPAPIAVESVTPTRAVVPESTPSEPSRIGANTVPAPVDDRSNVPRELPAESDRTRARGSDSPTPDAAPRAAVVPEPSPAIAPPVSDESASIRATSPIESPPPIAAPANLPGTSVPTPPPAPAPVRPPADEDAVRETLRRYEAAYRALDLNSVLQIYPSLGRDQADQLRRTFATVTQYDLEIRPSQIDVQSDSATVHATLARRITPRIGSPVSSEAATEFRLRRTAGVWSIVGIAAR